MFQFPIDKLACINRALVLTGNYQCSVLEDGSSRYNTSSAAYEGAIATLLEEGNYGFGTKVWTLTPSPTAPADTDWDTAYPLPADLVHIIWVKININITNPAATLVNNPTLYDILAGQLVVNAQGGPPPPASPVTPAVVTMKGVSSDNSDIQSGTPLFVDALLHFVMSGIYRGLHGDTAEADKTFKLADAIAQRARTRYDMQKPKRELWRSRISAARRTRRPQRSSGLYDNSGSWSG